MFVTFSYPLASFDDSKMWESNFEANYINDEQRKSAYSESFVQTDAWLLMDVCKSDVFTYKGTQQNCTFHLKKETHIYIRLRFRRHSKYFSEPSYNDIIFHQDEVFCLVICDFRVSAVPSHTAALGALSISAAGLVCVSVPG